MPTISASARVARTCTPEIMQPLSPEWLAAVQVREEGRGGASEDQMETCVS